MACVQDKLSSSATAAGQGPSWPWLCSFCPFTFVLRHLWSQGENEKVGVRRGDNTYEVRRGEKFAKDWPDSWTKYLWLDHLCLLTGLFSSMFQKNGFQALQKNHRLCRKLSTSQRQEDLRVSLFSKGDWTQPGIGWNKYHIFWQSLSFSRGDHKGWGDSRAGGPRGAKTFTQLAKLSGSGVDGFWARGARVNQQTL